MNYSNGEKWKAFVLRWEDVKDCQYYEDGGGYLVNDGSNSSNPFILDVVKPNGKRLGKDEISRVK